MDTKDYQKIPQIIFDVGYTIFIGIFLNFLFSSIGFVFHKGINLIYPCLSLMISIGTLYYILKKNNSSKKDFFYAYLIFLLVIFITYFISLSKMDSSWDGRAYHQLGIILLGNGYNPIYDSINLFSEKFFNNSVNNLIWVETYPKFMEIVASNIFILTKQIESGKILNFLLMFITFAYSFYILNKNQFSDIKLFFKTLISLIIVFNPVVLAQMFTYYIDFSVYLLFVIIILSIIDLEISKNKYALSIFLMASVCLLNVKWGGFLYYITTAIIYVLYLLFINKEKIFALKFVLTNLVVIFLTTLTLLNPIYTNIKNYHNPLYPLTGKDKLDIMTPCTPKEFLNQNRFKNLFISTFCKVNNTFGDNAYSSNIELKIPFSIHKNELHNLYAPDTRECGFGVLWSGIILLSILLVFFIKFHDEKNKKIYILLFSLFILLIALNPYSWWARYAPHIWLLPILVSICILNKKVKTKWELIIISLLYLSIITNLIIQIIYVSKEERHFRKELNSFIENIDNDYNSSPLEIYGTYDMAIIQNLKERNIKYKFVFDEYYKINKETFKVMPKSLGGTMLYKMEGR